MEQKHWCDAVNDDSQRIDARKYDYPTIFQNQI